MDAAGIVDIVTRCISNVGFPIVCVGVMFYQSMKDREFRTAERDKWLAAINAMSATLNKLYVKLGGDDD